MADEPRRPDVRAGTGDGTPPLVGPASDALEDEITGPAPSEREPGRDLDAALARLEDLLLSLPFDRAVPDLAPLLADAGLPQELLLHDRARKVLHEALLARPFGDRDEVARVRTEVDLLALELDVLVDRLEVARTQGDAAALASLGTRLAEIRQRSRELRAQL